MKLNNVRIVTGLLALTLFLGAGVGLGEAAPEQKPAAQTHLHQYVQGTVVKERGGTVFIKTDQGATRTISLNELQTELSGKLKEGDRVRLEIEEGNQIIDIDRISAGVDHPERHATVTGELVRFDPAGKTVVLNLEDGRHILYGLKDPAATKMAMVEENAQVELTLDEESGLVNDFIVK